MSNAPQDAGKVAQQPDGRNAAPALVNRGRTSHGRRPLVLPTFVARRTDPRPGESLRDYWAVSETGDWERDVETGCAYTREAMRFLREERAPHMLTWIASDMIGKRHVGPIEVGFFHEIGALIVRTKR